MATIAQLEAEPYWGREIVTSPMVGLGIELRTLYGTGSGSVGIKGNERHLSGGHRSQEWIKRSAYCTNRTYATQSGLTGDQLLYCAALDFTPGVWGSADNRAKMRVLTKRVIDAMQAGRCNELLEVFGTLDGSTVTGWRNDLNVAVTSDSSHLDHLHLRFDRRYANDNAAMSKVAAILLGDDMATADDVWRYNFGSSTNPRYAIDVLKDAAAAPNSAEIKAMLDALPQATLTVDPAALKAALLDPEVLSAIGDQVARELRARLES